MTRDPEKRKAQWARDRKKRAEERAAYLRTWRAKNRAKLNAKQAKRYEEKKAHILAQQRRRYHEAKADPVKHAAMRAQQRAAYAARKLLEPKEPPPVPVKRAKVIVPELPLLVRQQGVPAWLVGVRA